MEEKKQKLLKKLLDLKVMAVNALEGKEPLFAVDTNEMLDLIELAFQIYDAERKPGFTLRRYDNNGELIVQTVETECLSIMYVGEEDSTCINWMNATCDDIFNLVSLHQANIKKLETLLRQRMMRIIESAPIPSWAQEHVKATETGGDCDEKN